MGPVFSLSSSFDAGIKRRVGVRQELRRRHILHKLLHRAELDICRLPGKIAHPVKLRPVRQELFHARKGAVPQNPEFLPGNIRQNRGIKIKDRRMWDEL